MACSFGIEGMNDVMLKQVSSAASARLFFARIHVGSELKCCVHPSVGLFEHLSPHLSFVVTSVVPWSLLSVALS